MNSLLWPVAALSFVACSGAVHRPAPLQETRAPWEAARYDAEPVVLRRRHVAGEALLGRAQFTYRQVATNAAGTVQGESHGEVHWKTDVISAEPGGSFRVRTCTLQGRVVQVSAGGEQREEIPPRCPDDGSVVTELNGWPPRTAPSHGDEPVAGWDLELVPATDFVTRLPFPRGALQPGDSWSAQKQWTDEKPGRAPVAFERRVTWRFLGVEHAADGLFARLVCTGEIQGRFVARPEDGSREARGVSSSRFQCAHRLSVRDGAAGAWRVDFTSTGRVDLREGKTAEALDTTVVGHLEGQVDRP